MEYPIEQLLFLFLIGTSLVVMYLEDLFAAAMVTSVFSLISACLYTLMDAVDVAFTEAAVGAGISTVLILGTLSLTTDREYQQPLRLWPLLVIGITGAVLVYGTLDLPTYGEGASVINSHVVPRYITGSATEFHIPNIVTNVLAGYRGYDTMGETTVILTATLGVMLLLGAGRKPKLRPTAPGERKPRDRRLTMSHKAQHVVMRDYVILRVVANALVPFIMLFAFYVQFHGDFGPGGGFQAGVILGAGVIVYGLILGLAAMQAVAPPAVVEIGLMVGVLMYAGTGVACLLQGGNFLDYAVLRHDPVHGRHLGIALVEGGVGITVCCAMIWIFYSFAGRRMAREEQKERDE